MDGEFETDEVGEDRGGALLRFDRGGVWGRGHLAGKGEAIIVYQLVFHFLPFFIYSCGIEGGRRSMSTGKWEWEWEKRTAQCLAL